MNQWFFQTPERALDQAYDASLIIKALEDEYFGGQKIDPQHLTAGNQVYSYFEEELQKYLNITRLRLAEFKASRSVLSLSDPRLSGISWRNNRMRDEEDMSDRLALRLEKLRFIDDILSRYQPSPSPSMALIPRPPANPVGTTPPQSRSSASSLTPPSPRSRRRKSGPSRNQDYSYTTNAMNLPEDELEAIIDRTSFVPRSILGTFDRLRRELDPEAEEEVVKSFRSSKTKTVVSLRFVLLLILVPLLMHQVSKNFLVGPIVDHFRPETNATLFLNEEMEEEALADLERFEHRLKFQSLLYNSPRLTDEETEEKIQKRAEKIAHEYRERGSNAIKNIFSDILSAIAFSVILLISRREVEILKSFIDDIIYGLSDSAKAFIIILFTDMFVGFHSPHGWEIVLEGVSRHFGLPESRDFIYLFIATFPVILDTVFKYWIFRYLNRISPSAVATYRNMNE